MTKEEIQQILSDLGTIDMRDTKMIVVTNERKLDGAAAIFYPGVMETDWETNGRKLLYIAIVNT